MESINPCPDKGCKTTKFGNGPAVWKRGGEYRNVMCGCGIAGPMCASEEAAITAWNRINMLKELGDDI